ncbi:MAG: processive 1,2-diacylglycerol beta-glucosyltransferase [Solirubrobacteraceae bacterium]|jgi:UDP-N-acetylglucosamine:LPS N-acetylglucosamine transferase|nr:processive 1,2-diacylglycerol beta-glucosyltransferase [Solirubrobacteraceae bacterium]
MSAPPNGPHRVLILSAAIGEGHDLPARIVAEELQAESPGTHTEIDDGLRIMGWPLSNVITGGSAFHSKWGNRMFDVEFWLVSKFPPTMWLSSKLVYLIGARRMLRAIAAARPDIIVSTYPGVTELLGQLRRRGRLHIPVVSAITDLAALRYWAHPGVDLHLLTHPESAEEVRRIAPASDIVAVRGLNSPDFLVPRDRDQARRDLEVPDGDRLVVVSGGGWAVGDLEGAVAAALDVPDTLVIALCGRNEDVRARLAADFAGQPRVRVEGFTDRMGDLLAAADALIHSTAGLTVLEAHVRGCPTISYGWGRAHIRVNNQAFTRFGLAEVATTRPQLAQALRRALARRREPDLSFAQLPSAASLVLDRLGGAQVADGGGGGQHRRAGEHHGQ